MEVKDLWVSLPRNPGPGDRGRTLTNVLKSLSKPVPIPQWSSSKVLSTEQRICRVKTAATSGPAPKEEKGRNTTTQNTRQGDKEGSKRGR